MEVLPEKINVAIFASGTGSNAKKIAEYFNGHAFISISLIVSNKADAGVLNIAAAAGIPVLLISKERFFNGDAYLPELKSKEIGFIVLAGFLWKIPDSIIKAFPHRIINIHPALLPKYGGKGMYGASVHGAVVSAGEKESGISIHYVDEHYDSGDIIFQATCPVEETDTASTLSEKVHQLEHQHYPRVIEEVIKGLTHHSKNNSSSFHSNRPFNIPNK
jgi:phosphoribosylglycinamide formyltransferase 1